MRNNTVEELASELQQAYEKELCKPFPYIGSLKLRREGGDCYEGLIPDLDMYFSDIAGCCSWGKRVLKWPKEKVEEARNRLAKTFFDKHPQYKPLEPMITESNTPDLYASLSVYEMMRTNLLTMLSQLLTERR